MKVAMILHLLLCRNDHDFEGHFCFFSRRAPNCDGPSEESMISRDLISMPRAF